jgi:L-ascorbate metabolism protein UlaG (beta-lactamase superfamily)
MAHLDFTRRSLLGSLAAAAAAVPAMPQSAERILDQIRSHHSGIAVWWVGNAGWLIKADNLLFGVDLDLSAEDKLAPAPISARDLAGLLDVAFVTHHHGDHCNEFTIRTLAREGKCQFVLPQPCVKEVARVNIPKERIAVPEPLHPFDIRGIHVEPLHAIHGNPDFTVLTREPDFVESIAHNCGYVFNVGGKRFFHPGDSVLTEEHLALKNIDVLFVSPTIHNMYIDRSAILINHLEPAYIFPQHTATYQVTDQNAYWTRGYPDELKARLSLDLQKRYHKPRPGEMFVIR